MRARPLARRPAPPRGFSLLEVLVAFVILSLVATALSRLFGGSLANAGAAEEYSRALIVAESVLSEVGSAKPLREGTKTGSADDGRIAWKATVAPYDAPGTAPELAAASATMPLRLWRVAVDVDFPAPAGGRRTVALATTRIGAREALQ
jgi:general secretion pathway protein I